MGNVTDVQLITVLSNLVHKFGGVPVVADVRVEVPELGIVRLIELSRGGSTFLMDRTGRVLQYVVPLVTHEQALRDFKAGRQTALPDGALESCGFES